MAAENTVANEAVNLIERLNIKEYSAADCLASIRGERLPRAMGFSLTRHCVVRGIRYHHGFGQELRGIRDEFTRALNARSIMSNIIPDMNPDRPEQFPYCIWHPDVASEDTYRELARRYPQMAYHIGRACAVAGYTDLYVDLQILPEVHIAEEARECGNKAIFDAIMANPVKYSVMNDYNRSVDIANPRCAPLNGDTAVRSSLENKQKYQEPFLTNEEEDDKDDYMPWSNPGYNKRLFNITEDWGIDGYNTLEPETTEDVTPLLYMPLPADLPTMNKDLLILMAAYYGDVDRYTRLRRPVMIQKEIACVVRGIYHNTMFAKWWSLQTPVPMFRIQEAITARFIMNNDLCRITPEMREAPYLIWYPSLACESTYKELARRKSDMKPQVLRSCIVGNFHELFDEVVHDVAPDSGLVNEASASHNRYYLEVLEKRVAELGIMLSKSLPDESEWKKVSRLDNIQETRNALRRLVTTNSVYAESNSIYNGYAAEVNEVELGVCVPDEWKWFDESDSWVELNYVDWPRKKEDFREEKDSPRTNNTPKAPDSTEI
jgi:hypothetical protein